MPRVAILDDDQSVLNALARQLRTAGMEVYTFKSGLELLSGIDHARPDCLLLDIHMRGINGFEVHHRLLRRGIRLPTVVITAHDDQQIRNHVHDIGARFLAKPFSAQSLLENIESVCESDEQRP